MSLQIWLPLNGNLNNQGLANVSVTNYNATVYDTGKIGKCYSFNGSNAYIKIGLPSSMTTIKNTTICMWVKSNASNALNGPGGISQDVSADNNVTCCTLFTSGWQFILNSAYNYIDSGFSKDTNWHHYVCSIDSNNIYVYFDGVLKSTTAIGNRLTNLDSSKNFIEIGCDHPGGDEYLNGYVNDFRVYDNALSSKEIREIYKSMIMHYPLNDIYSSSCINKYKGEVAEGKPTGYSNTFTITKLENERGYKLKYSYTGTGSNHWDCFNYGTFTFTVGKTYDYSCKVRCNSRSNTGLYFRAARCDNDWVTKQNNVLINDGVWHEYHIQQTIPASFDRSGETVTSNPVLEFYTDNLDGNGTIYSFDIDIKDIQVVESSVSIPFMDGQFSTTLIADTSGFGNNGTSHNLQTWNSSSPMYNGCYQFNGTNQFITTPQSVKVTDEITVNLWANALDLSKLEDRTQRLISCTESGGWNFEAEEGTGKIRFIVYANNAYICCTSSLKWTDLSPGWHMFTGTYDGKSVKLYIDGVCVKEIMPYSIKTPIKYNSGNTVFIGTEAVGTTTIPESGKCYSGYISDVRIYATALSASDIKELYNTPVSISNNGTLITKGEFIEK